MRKLLLVVIILSLAVAAVSAQGKPYAIICAVYRSEAPEYRMVILTEAGGVHESELMDYAEMALYTFQLMQKYTIVHADEVFKVLKEVNFGSRY